MIDGAVDPDLGPPVCDCSDLYQSASNIVKAFGRPPFVYRFGSSNCPTSDFRVAPSLDGSICLLAAVRIKT
jgi:hypothetical protein